jgi:hypothetical protein
MTRRLCWTMAMCAAAALLVLAASTAMAHDGEKPAPGGATAAQAPEQPKPSMDIYGFAMLDMGQNFKTINPSWYDTMRVTKLPSVADQFGLDNSTFAGVRQSRFGVKTSSGTSLGELKTQFEFELFGVGVDEGQTTFRLRHAYGQLGHVGAGQTWSPFMDPDVFPNSLEYWGPTGMVFFRNIQARYMPMMGDDEVVLALEKPGASGDPGVLANRIELQNVKGRFPLPDVSGHYKMTRKWGHFQAAGMLRRIKWDDVLTTDKFDLSGDAWGWGLNLSSNLKFGKADVLRLQLVYGEGIENYMNDSPVDVGIQSNGSNATTPVVGKTLPIVGTVIFLDHSWNDKWTSSVGFSSQNITNSDGQAGDAFHAGYYALGNLLFSPVANVMMGGEFQWGRRVNFSDNFQYDGYKMQFSFKYNFSHRLGG